MKEKPILLWVSMMAPYDSVMHASGKIQNFYLKELHATKKFQLKLLSLCKPEEVVSLDLENYGISYDIKVRRRTGLLGFWMRGISWLSKFNIWNAYAGLTPLDIYSSIRAQLTHYASTNAEPVVIVLDWTEILFLLPHVKQLFPKAKIVAIEEDVAFLGYARKAEFNSNILLAPLLKEKARRVEALELKYLAQCNLIVLNNEKDRRLLEARGLSKQLWVWAPYFISNLNFSRKKANKDILFFGAMSREENWRSAIWFIENVMPLIKNPTVRFLVAGINPPQQLKKYASSQIQILGAVKDVAPLFQECLCLAAPLVLGAGVKIKVLEAFSAGIPVLTNAIGIEGIDATDQKDFFYCESPSDYVGVIQRLLSGEIDACELEKNEKELIRKKYNFEQDAERFSELLMKLSVEQ